MQVEDRSLEGWIEWKNLLGFGETWEATGHYGSQEESEGLEMSCGLSSPRLKTVKAFLRAQAALSAPSLSFPSTYNGLQHAGVTAGVWLGRHQGINVSLNWRNPRNENASIGTIDSLFPSIQHVFRVDKRDSVLRPATGYAFRLATRLSGAGFDLRQYSLRQVRIDPLFPLNIESASWTG